MKKFLNFFLIVIFLFIISYFVPYLLENEQIMKEPKKYEEISKNVLSKGSKLKINLEEANRYFWRAKKQVLYQKNKIFIFRNYDYSQYLYQKSIDYALKEILTFKEKEKKEKESFAQKFKEIKDLNSQILEIFDKIPLGSNFFKIFIHSTLQLKEAENYYKINRLEMAKKKLELASYEINRLFSEIKNSLKNFYDPQKIKEWKNLYNEALRLSLDSNIIVVIKDERILKVLRNGKIFKTYSVEFGKNPLEKKMKSGDLATPEGRYKIIEKRGQYQTKYYLALLLNYPNEEDKRRFEEAKRRGIMPKNAKIGGLIEIHGDGGQGIDWTEGCVALSNDDMKELFNITAKGTPVYIIGSLGNNNVLSDIENPGLWKNSKKS